MYPEFELKKLFIKLVIEMKDFIAFNLFIKSFKIVKVLIRRNCLIKLMWNCIRMITKDLMKLFLNTIKTKLA